jgi:DUF438 domain-containing protein
MNGDTAYPDAKTSSEDPQGHHPRPPCGGDVEALKKRFGELVREVSGGEIGAMEQELITEGLPEEEVRKLCDVHVRIFEDALACPPAPAAGPGHPLQTLADENRALEGVVAEVQKILSRLKDGLGSPDRPADLARLAPLAASLAEIEKHYLKKENQLFPRLEAKGIGGPSKVMWAVHDDIRAHLKDFRRALELGDAEPIAQTGQWVLQEIRDMINKEEKILFPMVLEKLDEPVGRSSGRGDHSPGSLRPRRGRRRPPGRPARRPPEPRGSGFRSTRGRSRPSRST